MHKLYDHFAPEKVRSIVISMSVCLSVCSHDSKIAQSNFSNFLHDACAVAVAQSSSDGVTISYVFPVLRMTSCFHAMGLMGRMKQDVMV